MSETPSTGEPNGEEGHPDILRLCKALDLCGAMFGLWLATMIVTLFLLRTPWWLIPGGTASPSTSKEGPEG